MNNRIYTREALDMALNAYLKKEKLRQTIQNTIIWEELNDTKIIYKKFTGRFKVLMFLNNRFKIINFKEFGIYKRYI
jgi:hypothetical protein